MTQNPYYSDPRTTNAPVQFEPLARVLIKDGTYLVISLRSDGKVSIAQQVQMVSGERVLHLYLKNAIEVKPENLKLVKDAVDAAYNTLFGNAAATEEEA